MKYIKFLLLLLPLISSGQKKERKPNVLLIFADDLGYGDVQCYGGKVKTPNIDRLAAKGMKFSKAYLPASVCSPSRYSLLTGRYFWRTPKHPTRGVLTPSHPSAFYEDELTLQKMFQNSGYKTAVFGKWHLGIGKEKGPDFRPLDIVGGPLDFGFDTFFGTAGNAENPPQFLIENRRFVGRKEGDKFIRHQRKDIPWKFRYEPWDESMRFKTDEVSNDTTESLLKYLENDSGDKPFFIYWASHIPHKPITPHKKFVGKSDFGPYGDFLLELDTNIGDALKILEKKGELDNTLIIFTSDNGGLNPINENFAKQWHMDEMWQAQQKGHIINGPLSLGKHDVLDGGFRVPFIVKWPGKIPAGRTSDELICSTDVMATCAAVLDYKLPENAGVDGVNLLPHWTGKSDSSTRNHVILDGSDGTFAVRRGKWKFIEKNTGKRVRQSGKKDQLYDVENDIGEKNNLMQQYPEIVKELRDLLDLERQQVKGLNGVPYPRPDQKHPSPQKKANGSVGNLLPEGGFEQMKGQSRPAGWIFKTFKKGTAIGTGSTEPVEESGNNALKVSCTGGQWTLMSRFADAQVGKTYTLSLRAKALDAPTRVTIALNSPWELAEEKKVVLTAEWKRYTLTAKATQLGPGNNIRARIDLLGAGSILIDDVTISCPTE